ncbi:hypothetical protein Bca101_073403 [Brassica carinata]
MKHYKTKVEHVMPTNVKPHVSKGINQGKVFAQMAKAKTKEKLYVYVVINALADFLSTLKL